MVDSDFARHTGRGTFVVHGGDEILFTEGANRSPGVMFGRGSYWR